MSQARSQVCHRECHKRKSFDTNNVTSVTSYLPIPIKTIESISVIRKKNGSVKIACIYNARARRVRAHMGR